MEAEPTGVFDHPAYAALAVENREHYRTAAPFPHIWFDDFLDPALARALSRDFPSPEQDIDWVINDHENSQKRYQHDETKLPLLTRKMLREFNSKQFVLFLETLTGIESLIPDPFFIGGGAHVTGRGGYLRIHADFNWLHKLQLHRRVNALLYLNEEWDEGWGGALELWNKDMTEAAVKIAPRFNRLAIFSTNEDSNHGHPLPLQVPPGVHRKVLNVYFYTSAWDEVGEVDPHFTKYKPQASPFAMEISNQYVRSAGAAGGGDRS